MTVPAFLNSSHYIDTLVGVVDVQTIITQLATTLKTTNSPVWTEPVAGTYKSPVDADGRWFSVVPTKIDADTLQIVVNDPAGAVSTQRIDLNADPGNIVRIYSGQYHLWIDSLRATPEGFRSGMLDLSPQTQSAWATQVYGHGHRDSGGNPQGGTILSLSGGVSGRAIWAWLRNNDAYGLYRDPAGNSLYWPSFLTATYNSNVCPGRMYQVLIGPGDLAIDTEVVVPIDTGVTAKFRVAAVATVTGFKVLIRAD